MRNQGKVHTARGSSRPVPNFGRAIHFFVFRFHMVDLCVRTRPQAVWHPQGDASPSRMRKRRGAQLGLSRYRRQG